MELKINPLFRDKIPPLTEDEFQRLEENIVADGEVLEPIIVWGDTIIDGHNRWKIIQKHPELQDKYEVKQMEFPDEWAAIVWMCRNQLGRRNITEAQRDYLLMQEYEAQAKTNGGQGSNQYTKMQLGHNDQAAKTDTRSIVAQNHGISPVAVRRAVEFGRGLDAAEEVSPGFKQDVISGAVKAPKKVIAEIRNVPDDKKGKVVEAIKKGTGDGLKEAKDIIASATGKTSGKQETQGRKHLDIIVGGPVPEEHTKYSYAPADEDSFVNDMENQLQGIVGSTIVKLNYFVMDGDVCKKMSQEYKDIIFEQGKQIISQLKTIFSYLGKEE